MTRRRVTTAAALATALVVLVALGPVHGTLVAALGTAAVVARQRLTPARADRHVTDTVESTDGTPPSATAWAQFLDAAASEVRSGASLAESWRGAARRHPVTGSAVSPHRTLAAALDRTTDDRDEAVVLQVAGAAAALGGPVAATLDAGAALLRERAAARADALAHSAQARLSARVMTAVPLVFAAWSAVSSASFRGAVASPVGAASIVLGAGLNTVGWRWMRAVVDRATP